MRGVSKAAGVGLVLGVAFAAFAATPDRPVVVPALDCELTVQAESVPVRPDSVVLRMIYSEPIGDELVAQLEEESGVKVVKVERESTEPLAVKVTLDTSQAKAGEWNISLKGEGGECKGTVKVDAAEEAPSDGTLH
jgi:hypothetical protein